MKRSRTVLLLFALAGAVPGAAHDFSVTHVTCLLKADGAYQIDLRVDVDALALGVSPEMPSAAVFAELEGLPPEEFERCVERARETIQRRTRVRFDGERVLSAITFPEPEELAGEPPAEPSKLGTIARLTGRVPAGAQVFTFGASRAFQAVRLTLVDLGRSEYLQETLSAGADSTPYALRPTVTDPTAAADAEPAPRAADAPASQSPAPEPPAATPSGQVERGELRKIAPSRTRVMWEYLVLGFEHILPLGIDHILFVLGLFLLSRRWAPLLWQISAFTVAHTATLALSMSGVVALPDRLVESLIAASIAYVAIENLFTQKLTLWRPALVFGFGLLHGLGFAGVLRELGLPEGEFVPALISFNVGVELGQLAVVAAAFAVVGWCRHRDWYRPVVASPASALIAVVGLWWAFERAVYGV